MTSQIVKSTWGQKHASYSYANQQHKREDTNLYLQMPPRSILSQTKTVKEVAPENTNITQADTHLQMWIFERPAADKYKAICSDSGIQELHKSQNMPENHQEAREERSREEIIVHRNSLCSEVLREGLTKLEDKIDLYMNLVQNNSPKKKTEPENINPSSNSISRSLSRQCNKGENDLRAAKLNSLMSHLQNMEVKEKKIRLVADFYFMLFDALSLLLLRSFRSPALPPNVGHL